MMTQLRGIQTIPGVYMPVWRNGRRNGLKIRYPSTGVWVQVPRPVPKLKESWCKYGETTLLYY